MAAIAAWLVSTSACVPPLPTFSPVARLVATQEFSTAAIATPVTLPRLIVQ